MDILFPATKEFSKNEFVQEWKKQSLLEALLEPPPILVEELSEKWILEFRQKVGDGPHTTRLLWDLNDYVRIIRHLKGYSDIKRRLCNLDSQLFSTHDEIEFICTLLEKLAPENISLEGTFEYPSGSNLDLKVSFNHETIFFDITSIEDYAQMGLILSCFNILSAIQWYIGKKGIKKNIVLKFSQYPKEQTLLDIHQKLSQLRIKDLLSFSEKNPAYEIALLDGDSILFDMPLELFENKIKDKIEEKSAQFKEGYLNFIVMDVTRLVITPLGVNDELKAMVKRYFQYSKNSKVCGVWFQSKAWIISAKGIEYKLSLDFVGNPLVEENKSYGIMEKLWHKQP